MDVCYSELTRELKEIKRARQRLDATRDTLYGAAFVNPPALGAVKRQKRSRSGSWSSSVFRSAHGKDHDPVPSKLAVWRNRTQVFSRHTPFSGRPSSSAAKVVDGIGGQLTALWWPPPTGTKSASAVEQRMLPRSDTKPWKWPCKTEIGSVRLI